MVGATNAGGGAEPGRVLETSRLILRPHGAADLDDVAATWADPAVVGPIPKLPSSREESWGRILRYAGLWSLLGFGYWAVRERGTERFVGDVGFADFRREVAPSLEGSRECGWVLARWAQGRGYGGEAVAAAMAWHDAHAPRVPATCIVSPSNAASLRLAETAGFARWAQTDYAGGPAVLLRRAPRDASRLDGGRTDDEEATGA